MSLNIVLYEPEIPFNTAAIGRTCVLTDTKLHLIKPLGFSLSDKSLRRAGLDYWHLVDLNVYNNFEEFLETNGDVRLLFASTKANCTYSDVKFSDGDYIVFGRESSGLPKEIMEEYRENLIRIPMTSKMERSLNLSNSANIILYEALRQIGFPNLD